MIFNLDDLDFEYTKEYITQEKFALPEQMDTTKTKIYILSQFEKNKKPKLDHC